MKLLRNIAACGLLALGLGTAVAQEAAIRKNLAERLPNWPKIDEVRKTPMPGLYEIRVDTSKIFYTDSEGNFLIEGDLVDTKTRQSLTDERIAKLLAVDFSTLPLDNAFTVVRGNGKRKIAVFEDPNCSFCKQLQHDLQKLDNVTVHTFLLPMLGGDSPTKSRNVWCSRNPAKAWHDMMLKNINPPSATCDVTALYRNMQFAARHRITGTPTMFFEDGQRVASYINTAQMEKILSAIK